MPWTTYNDQLNQELITLMTDPNWTTNKYITDRITAIKGIQDTAGASLSSGQDARLQTLLADFKTNYDASQAANESRYGELKTGYNNLSSDVTNTYLTPAVGKYDAAVASDKSFGTANNNAYAGREASLNSQFAGLGNQARADVNQIYNQQYARADQDLANRGLGNTTVRNAVTAGIGNQNAQDMSRLNEQLRTQQLGFQGQWSGDTLNAAVQNQSRQNQMATQGAGFYGQIGQQVAGLKQEPLGVIERRTDVGPSLSDLTNLTLQLGRGSAQQFAMGPLQPLTSYQQATAPR